MISLAYLTNAGSNVRAVRSMLALRLLEGVFDLYIRVLWPAMMRVVDDNRCLLSYVSSRTLFDLVVFTKSGRQDALSLIEFYSAALRLPRSMNWQVRAGFYGT